MLKKTSKLLETLSNPRYWSGLRHGIVPSIEHKLALKGLNVRTVLDVGANRGQFSLLARCLYPAATIYAFEPLQRPAERFRALFADQSNVHLFQVGIGEALGETKMFVANDHHASSSILKAHKQSQIFGSRETGEETVRVGRLNDFLPLDRICAPCLLKIDVQGYELQVIKGCREALPLVDYLYVECCYVELYARQALAHEILVACVDAGGSITGEHGVGSDKACAMPLMFSESDLEVMKRLRRAFDPDGLANPGKLFPTPRLCGEVPGPYRAHPLEKAGIADRF